MCAGATAIIAAEGDPDARFGFWIDPPVLDSPGGSATLKVFLGSTADRVQGWSFGIKGTDGAIPGAMVRIVNAQAGGDLMTAGPGGGPPGFLSCTLWPAETECGVPCPDCTAVTQGVVLDFLQQTFVNATTGFHLLTLSIEVGGEAGASARLDFTDEAGVPPIKALVVLDGLSYVPARQDGIEIRRVECAPDFYPRVASVTGAHGTQQTVGVYLDFNRTGNAAFDVQGWSFGIRHDPHVLDLLDATADGTDTMHVRNGAEPDFNQFRFVPADPPGATEGFTHGVVIDFQTGITLAPRNNFLDCAARYRLAAEPPCPEPIVTHLTPTGALGVPAVRMIMVVDGESLVPCASGAGEVRIACSAPFVRGNSNGDGRVDIADGVFIFYYLFRGGRAPVPLDAADVNDDGAVDSSDGVYIVYHQFLNGPPPPPPFPLAGLDPTSDNL
ncbi:MAG TPA: hypothetical protein DCM87_03210 [Planctomycetes bacterium]|nr:hypothetical protein [Planctomycetota bacterium]